jgi:hypothetical protein
LHRFENPAGCFVAAFPDRMVAEISTKDVDEWLAGLSLAPVTRNTFEGAAERTEAIRRNRLETRCA